jgi:hypothetical protein
MTTWLKPRKALLSGSAGSNPASCQVTCPVLSKRECSRVYNLVNAGSNPARSNAVTPGKPLSRTLFMANADGTTPFHGRGRGFESRRFQNTETVAQW